MIATIVAVLVVFGGLIFFHELGHFSVARSFGMGVSTFSLGFGPKILKKKIGKTEYAVSLVPLGGYVALVGESVDAEIPSGFTAQESFSLRPAWQRLLVVLAGPMANMVLALVLCVILALGWGESTMTSTIGDVSKDSPAEAAGILGGDRILSIDGVDTSSWEAMGSAIEKSAGEPMRVEVLRKDESGQESVIVVNGLVAKKSERKTLFGETEIAWLIGVRAAGVVETRELGLLESFSSGWSHCLSMIKLTWQGFVKLAERVIPADQLGGPIMIAQVIGQQASHGSLGGILSLAALISINLGILNLLPVPVLDGGTVVFCIYEIVFRRKVNERLMGYAIRVGIALLVALMVFATFNDVVRLFK